MSHPFSRIGKNPKKYSNVGSILFTVQENNVPQTLGESEIGFKIPNIFPKTLVPNFWPEHFLKVDSYFPFPS